MFYITMGLLITSILLTIVSFLYVRKYNALVKDYQVLQEKKELSESKLDGKTVPGTFAGVVAKARNVLVPKEAWKKGTTIDEVSYRQGVINTINWFESQSSTDQRVRNILRD